MDFFFSQFKADLKKGFMFVFDESKNDPLNILEFTEDGFVLLIEVVSKHFTFFLE